MREQKLFRMLHNAIFVTAFGYTLLVLGESASLKRILARSQREFKLSESVRCLTVLQMSWV
jgi:hypothetical protein